MLLRWIDGGRSLGRASFGDPQVPPRAAGTLPGEGRLARLATSAEEVREIGRISGGPAELHLGPENSKRGLLGSHVRGVPLLHLSTHATADDGNPERSRIVFSPAGQDQEPDYLFLKEVYDLDLTGVDLTTLSACDTGQNPIPRRLPWTGLLAPAALVLMAAAVFTGRRKPRPH